MGVSNITGISKEKFGGWEGEGGAGAYALPLFTILRCSAIESC